MGSGDSTIDLHVPAAGVAIVLVATIDQNVQFVAGGSIGLVGSVCSQLLHLASQASFLLLTFWHARVAFQLLCSRAAAGHRRR